MCDWVAGEGTVDTCGTIAGPDPACDLTPSCCTYDGAVDSIHEVFDQGTVPFGSQIRVRTSNGCESGVP